MHSFKSYHPLVNFIYFLLVIGSSMCFMHPVFLCISILGGLSHALVLSGKKALKTALYLLPLCFFAVLINFLFNHQGVTILAYFPSGNPLTLESVAFGFAAAAMLGAVLLHFSCFNAVMTSDKLLYLSGRILPALSLIFSMTLRFVPRFTAQMRLVRTARKGIGGERDGTVREKIRQGLSVLSVMITWSLENAIDTADSMRARGFGLPGRTAFSLYTFEKRDGLALLCMLVPGATVLWGGISGLVRFVYYPSMTGISSSLCTAAVFAAYALLCFLPVIIEIREVLQWKSLQSKI